MYRNLSLIALLAAQPLQAAEKPADDIKTLVFTGEQCLVTAKEDKPKGAIVSAVLGVVVPLAVEFLFDQAADELTKVRTKKSSGSLDMHLWTLETLREGAAAGSEAVTTDKLRSNLPGCVTVLTGVFSESAKGRIIDKLDLSVAVPPGASENVLIERLKRNGIEMDKVHLAFEARLASDEKTGLAFVYQPTYFKSFELLPGQSARKQGLVYNLSFQGPGTTPWGTVYSSAPINVGEVSKGYELHEDGPPDQVKKLGKLATGKLATPGISQDAYRMYLLARSKVPAAGQDEFRRVGDEFVYRSRADAAAATGDSACREEQFRGQASNSLVKIAGRFFCYYTLDGSGNRQPFDASDAPEDFTFAATFTPVVKTDHTAFMPVRLHAELVQTQKPTVAAKVFAELLGKAKPKVSGWAGGLFDEDAKFAERQSDLALEAAYYDAIAKYNALTPASDENARRALELALQRAEAAWRRAQDE